MSTQTNGPDAISPAEITTNTITPTGRGEAGRTVPLPGERAGRDPARAIKRGPSRVPPEVVAATQRDRLYDGLVHTVAAKGYANAKVSDICQAAGVTRPAFYALFDGKDDAFLATYRHGTGVLLRLMQQAYEDAMSPDPARDSLGPVGSAGSSDSGGSASPGSASSGSASSGSASSGSASSGSASPGSGDGLSGRWRRASREVLRVLLDVLAGVPAFAIMAIVEIEAVGPGARYERDQLLRRFDAFFTDAPGPRMPDELIGAVVGGIYAAIYRYVAAGRVSELPELLPTLAYFTHVPFLDRDEVVSELRAGRGTGEKISIPCAPRDAQ